MIDFGYGVKLDTIDRAIYARGFRNDQKYNRYFRQTGLISEEQHRQWLEKINNTPSIKMYSVVTKEDSTKILFKVIGVCGLTSIDFIHRKAEISCYTEGWKYDKEAIQTLIAHGFKDLNINRIWAETFETHTSHLEILDSLGFTREGTLKQTYYKNGVYINSIIHSMLKENIKIK